MEKLVRLYAVALELPAAYFDDPFREFQYKLRMTHYPYQEALADDEFGIAPHTDTSFLTLLAPNEVPGLSIRTQSGKWIDAPVVPGAFVVNGGQMLQRWTNDVFLATPHRAVNRSGGERYALAFFCDSHIDWPVAAVPTTVGPDRPPKYPTTWYTDYMIQYQKADPYRPEGRSMGAVSKAHSGRLFQPTELGGGMTPSGRFPAGRDSV